MSPLTIIRNPLNEKENLVFALNYKGGLKIVNTTLFISQDAHAAKPAEVEAGPAFAPSALTSALYRNTVCVFGITEAEDKTSTTVTVDKAGTVVTTPKTGYELGTIALLSPVFTRFHDHRTDYRSISSVTSSDGKEGWIYYRSSDGAIQQLTLSDMSLKKVETSTPIAPGTSLAAFIDSTGVPKVIYQTTNGTLYVYHGTDGGGLKILETDNACADTQISVTVGMVGAVETVFVYFIGMQGYLNRVKGNGKWNGPIPFNNKHEKFVTYQFAVISDKGEEQNTIYYLDNNLNFKEQKDEYKKMI